MNWIEKEQKRISSKRIFDWVIKNLLFAVTILCSSVIIWMISFIIMKGISPFTKEYWLAGNHFQVSLLPFLTGDTWFIFPNTYGIGFVIINTIYIMILSTLLAVPLSVCTALFITRIAPKKIKQISISVVELLASIPSIIYGVFGMGVITAFVKNLATLFGVQSAGGISILSTVLVLTFMIFPTITLISITSIRFVKKDIIDGSLALGASLTQTNFKVVLSSAKSGIFSGIILGVGRALGEATAISMVIGNKGTGPSFNLFDTSRTLTSTMLLGLKETSGMDYDIRFSVGLILIILIIVTNLILHAVKRKIGSGQ
ncbi:MAG: phosphate ABC transporter permease subunit PstC [Bacilli bacterium]|jgi:phosphate transport system permease protein|nr:phosphate ABC transporter permease subunit PstC [Bacilli bacterium]